MAPAPSAERHSLTSAHIPGEQPRCPQGSHALVGQHFSGAVISGAVMVTRARHSSDARRPLSGFGCRDSDRLMLEVGYFGALRVSELAGLTWSQIIPRETGEAQLAIVGKGDKPRNILIPADLAADLRELRGDAPASARVFPISERRINYIVKAAAKRAGINAAVSAHWLRHAHASHAIDEGAPITLVSQTLGHADLKTTSIYAHARPNDSSSRYLKRR